MYFSLVVQVDIERPVCVVCLIIVSIHCLLERRKRPSCQEQVEQDRRKLQRSKVTQLQFTSRN